jgi:hypothetical protein
LSDSRSASDTGLLDDVPALDIELLELDLLDAESLGGC